MTTEKAEQLIRGAREAGRLGRPRDYVAEARVLARGRQDSIMIEPGHLKALFVIIKDRDKHIGELLKSRRRLQYPVREQ